MSEEQSKQWSNEWTWELKMRQMKDENEEKDEEWVTSCLYSLTTHQPITSHHDSAVMRRQRTDDITSCHWDPTVDSSLTCQILIRGLPLVELTANCRDTTHPHPSPPPSLPSSSSSVVNSSLEQMLKTFTSISVTGEEKQRGARETPGDPSTHRPSPGWL